jgi:lipoate-protein ligase A
LRLRLIIDGPRDPRVNMAIDEAILRAGPDTLRIYTWQPSGLSLGRRTPSASVNAALARELGVIVVRRPTGGAALYHDSDGEVTYSIVTSDERLLSMSIPESAATIAEGVAEAARILGAPASVGGFQGPGGETLCYLNPGSSDVVVEGRKISGSAQLRLGGRILQHGTLLLRFKPHVWSALIPTRTPREELSRYVSGIIDILGRAVSFSEAIEALVEGFRRALGADMYPGTLTPREVDLAYRLLYEKYFEEKWNLSI